LAEGSSGSGAKYNTSIGNRRIVLSENWIGSKRAKQSRSLPEARALIPRVGRLPGIDGKAKMSKSQGNAIQLSATADEIHEAVRRMFTDPHHIKASDPGRVEGNVVFTYLDAFNEDHIAVEDLKARYIRGGLGDSIVKKRLDDVLQALLAPIRDRRRALARDPGYVLQVVKRGTARAREITNATLRDVRARLVYSP
jgi:tryptophanyl-tRNA synthetase